MTSPKLIVCSLDVMETIVAKNAARHLISLINDQMMPQTPLSVASIHHLKLSMNDIEAPALGYVVPSIAHVERLIEFALQWDRTDPMVIHCWAGISRSTAAAYITLCALNPDKSEDELAHLMRERSATATPNSLLIACADQVLGRSGRMINAIEAIGRGSIASEGVPFELQAIIEEGKQ